MCLLASVSLLASFSPHHHHHWKFYPFSIFCLPGKLSRQQQWEAAGPEVHSGPAHQHRLLQDEGIGHPLPVTVWVTSGHVPGQCGSVPVISLSQETVPPKQHQGKAIFDSWLKCGLKFSLSQSSQWIWNIKKKIPKRDKWKWSSLVSTLT